MYRHCLYCSADLGSNDAVEAFPTGKTLAFDAAKGRLWAVCPKCARWNLSPIEERWEAVEEAERLFRDTRLRAQSENVGLAKLADGTRLIRVGAALPGELAAWRYGSQLVRRRRRHLLVTGAVVAGALMALGGYVALAGTGGVWGVGNLANFLWRRRVERRVIFRLPAGESPTGQALALRRSHVGRAVLEPGAGGEGVAVRVDDYLDRRREAGWSTARAAGPAVVLGDAHARAFLGRAMVHVNEAGASRRTLEHAVELLGNAGSAERYLGRLAAGYSTLGGGSLPEGGRLALEMALHEEQERRALQGELALLEAAWREAEEIAAIADRLAAGALPPSTRS